jgi:hypothetical protein
MALQPNGRRALATWSSVCRSEAIATTEAEDGAVVVHGRDKARVAAG